MPDEAWYEVGSPLKTAFFQVCFTEKLVAMEIVKMFLQQVVGASLVVVGSFPLELCSDNVKTKWM